MLPRSLIAVLLAAWVVACLGCSPAPTAPKYPLKAECPMCGGSGGLDEQLPDGTRKPIACDNCNGTGERPVYPWEKRIPCEACKSAGQVGGVECPDCEGLGWTPKYDLKPMGVEDGTFGRVFDGKRIQRIKDNRARRVEVRRKIVDGWVSIWSGLSGLFGIPQRIIEGIVMVAVGICSLCCLALGVLLFAVLMWAGVRIYQGRPA